MTNNPKSAPFSQIPFGGLFFFYGIGYKKDDETMATPSIAWADRTPMAFLPATLVKPRE